MNIPPQMMNNNGRIVNDDPNHIIGSIGDFGGIVDIFAYSSYENMVKYCDLYDKCLEYWKSGKMFHNESLLKYHLKKDGLNIRRCEFVSEVLRSNIKLDGSYETDPNKKESLYY